MIGWEWLLPTFSIAMALGILLTEFIQKHFGPKEKKCDLCGEKWSPRHFWRCKGASEG